MSQFSVRRHASHITIFASVALLTFSSSLVGQQLAVEPLP